MNQGDPQLVAAPVFTIGSIALAFQLTEYIPGGNAVGLGTPLAIILGCTGLFLLVSTIWAAGVGQSFVACFAGTFGGFWISYGILVLALQHDWFKIPLIDIQRTVAAFSIAFAAFFFFLQGFAVVIFYAHRLAGPRFLRPVVVVLVLAWAPQLLALLGLFDSFFDFRKWAEPPRAEA